MKNPLIDAANNYLTMNMIYQGIMDRSKKQLK